MTINDGPSEWRIRTKTLKLGGVCIYICKRGEGQFRLRLAVTSHRRCHHGDALSASL